MYVPCRKEGKIPSPGGQDCRAAIRPLAPVLLQTQFSLLYGDAGSPCRPIALDSEKGLVLLWAQESSISITRFSRCHLPSRSSCAYFLTPLGLQQTGDGRGTHALVGSESPDIIRLSKWGRRIQEGGGSPQCRPGPGALSQHSLLAGSQVIAGQGHCRKGSSVRLRTENKCFGSSLTFAF